MTKPRDYQLLNNSRFYILCFSVLLSVAIFAWMRLAIASDQLFYIRVQQVYGYVCILFWYLALIVSPLGYAIGKQRVKGLAFARRAIGVSAFYFALLHGVVAVWGQLGGLGQLHYLPEIFRWSLLGGVIALVVLGLMALTSFDAAVRFMTFRRWKWLHRLVYIAGILAVLHVWSIGTHLAYSGVQIVAFAALVVLSGLEMYRIAKVLNEKYFHLGNVETVTLFIASWVVVSALIAVVPSFIRNYHDTHEQHVTNHEARPV